MLSLSKHVGMGPLDLSGMAPRLPHDACGGITFLPRSIDKARAYQPGGNPGPYNLTGLTAMMLEQLGITVPDFQAAVARAADEPEVVAFVTGATTPEKIAAWNAFVGAREPLGGNRVEARKVYPWLDERPDLRLVLDVLVEDDRRYFAAR